MSYPDRTAVTTTALDLTFVKIIDLPALPGLSPQYGLTTPIFFSGHTREINLQPDTVSSNMPCLWVSSYDSFEPLFTGTLSMGVAHADYAIRESGTGAIDDNSDYFEKQGYIDHLAVGFNRTLTPAGFGYYDPTVDFEFQRQVMGDFTGGVATVPAANATETQSIVFEDYLSNIYTSYIGTALASTTSIPLALFIFNPTYANGPDLTPTTEDQDRIGGFKIGASGAITRVSLFKGDAVANPEQGGQYTILAQCRDASNHYFIRGTGVSSYTICEENAWGTYVYNNYTPKFSDADLPSDLETLLTDGDANYRYVSLYGTDVGFLISYKKYNGSTWDPKFVLIDKEWTTVQHINATAGDATATTILTQGAGNTSASDINMMMEGGYCWIIGGTPAVPLIVEATMPAAPDEGESGDTSIRVWAFSLDDHDFYVLRLGSSETLVYDLKTGEWSSWESPNRTNWRLHVGQNWVGYTDLGSSNTDVIAGDDTEGILWVLNAESGLDDRPDDSGLSDPFTRVVTGGVQVVGRNVVPCGAVTIDIALGAPVSTDTSILLEVSDDLGHNWTNCGLVTVPSTDYSKIIEWRSLGSITAPGRLFRLTDTGASVRISGANMR